MPALLAILWLLTFSPAEAQTFTLVELNCENMFDLHHDTLKNDAEFTPQGARHWSAYRYWRKLNNMGQEILSSADALPDLVALLEVENDTVLHDLCRRSLLRNAGYDYLMTCSPDVRGLDVALLYRPSAFQVVCYESIGVPPVGDQRPTRDILYVRGVVEPLGDTLHVYVVHAPSRYGGERQSRPYRLHVARQLARHISQLGPSDHVVVCGDFNDYADNEPLLLLERQGLINVSRRASGVNGVARGTYRYRGMWRSIDHVFVSPSLRPQVERVYINDAPFLLQDESLYGGQKPRRTYDGFRWQPGFSDHLPLVVSFRQNL